MPAVSPPMSCIAFFGLRTTAQMSLAAFVTAGTTLFSILGMKSTMPIATATSAMTQQVVLSDELLLVSTAVAVIAAAVGTGSSGSRRRRRC